jgi:hypothetical protein
VRAQHGAGLGQANRCEASYGGGIMGQDKDGDSRGKDKGKNSVVVRLGDIAAGLGQKQILGWVKVGETCQNECWDNTGQRW